MKLVLVFVAVLSELASRLCGRLRADALSSPSFNFSMVASGAHVSARIDNGGFKVLPSGAHVDLKIHFKSAKVALFVFLGLVSIPTAFAQGWMWVEGPVEYAVAVTRFFERFETVVFPYPVFRHLYRGKPPFSVRRLGLRILLYLSVFVVPFIMPLRWK